MPLQCYIDLVGMVWAIRRNHNKMAVENMFPSCTTIILYDVISYLHYWGTQVKAEEHP